MSGFQTLLSATSQGEGPVVTLEVLTAAGRVVFRDWTRVRITRSLHELAGSFELEYDDRYRTDALRPPQAVRQAYTKLAPLMKIRLLVDGELVMTGWIEEVDWEVTGDQVRAALRGLDPGGDLIECSANPEGPAEYKGLTIQQIAQRLVDPYGVTVRAEVDVGAPLADYAIDVGESVFSALDKAVKQRGVLLTSDGLGAIVLTRSGSRRAPAPLGVGQWVSHGMQLSARERYSDYWVKGQVRSHGHPGTAPLTGRANPLPSRGPEGAETTAHARRPVAPAGEGTAYPLGAGPAFRPVSQVRRAAILAVGHAKDPAVTRYRPRVWVARTGAGGAPHQVLAEWRMRIARARAEHRRFTVPDFRAGPEGRLWRPNEVVAVQWPGGGTEADDPYDMLIEGVVYLQDAEHGSRTELTIVGIEAYDLEPLPDEHRRHRSGQGVARGASVTRVK